VVLKALVQGYTCHPSYLVDLLQEFASWDMGFLRQLAGSKVLLCQHTDSSPMAEIQEQRGLPLYSLASRLQKQKAKSNPYMIIFNFIGYFSLVLHDFPLSGTMWPSSCSHFSGFISLLFHPYLPATFSVLRPSLYFFWSSSQLQVEIGRITVSDQPRHKSL
jgi:hypothetical protein